MLRVIAAVGGLVVVLVSRGVTAGEPPRVEYRDDRLTVHADEASVGTILDEIGRQSGAEIKGEAPPTAPLSLDLDAVPVREGLQRILGDRSFTLTYGTDGRLKTVELKGGPQAAPPPTTPPVAAATGSKKHEKWDNVAKLFSHQVPIQLSPRLSTAMGSEEPANWERLLRTVHGSEDRAVRSDAIRAAMRAVESDAMMRDALVEALAAMDDAELTEFARAAAAQTPDAPEDLVRQIARETHVHELKTRARSVLRQLRLTRQTANASG